MELDGLLAILHQSSRVEAGGRDDYVERACSPIAVSLGSRRTVLLSAIAAAAGVGLSASPAKASKLDPSQTIITPPTGIKWSGWTGVPPHTAEMAALYGDLNRPGPYVVYMKWFPGYMSAPHQYATDRLSVVLSGVWWVNSGSDFDPENCVPAPAGSFVRRVAHTWHYDGVRRDAAEPAVIAIFGIGPVDLKLADPNKPSWRRW